VLAIGGSWMVTPALLSAGRWDDVGRLTREALAL
jgi:2-dehydro-3-deoxyphosphogluconate aldolase/(4S)-4-hydroxy-2-oxoglutarate aldolase